MEANPDSCSVMHEGQTLQCDASMPCSCHSMPTCMVWRRTLHMKAWRRYRRRWGSNMSMNSPSPMLLLEAVASAAFCAQLAAVMLPSRRNTSHCTHAGQLLSCSHRGSRHRVSRAWAGVGQSGWGGEGIEGVSEAVVGYRGWVVLV